MLIAAIISGVIGLILSVLWIISWIKSGDIFDSNPWYFWIGAFFNTVWFFTFLISLNWSWSTGHLTGYIYSASTTAGYTTAHIRFSQNAGVDVQPDFCVKADSKPGRQIQELAGSGKKVQVTIPTYFYFANNPFACGTTKMTIELAK